MYEINPERGTKRTCQSCAVRFYDLSRTPIMCPKCGAEYIEIVRPVSVPYQRRRRGLYGPNDPSQPLPAEESEAPEAKEEGEEGEEGGERELDGEGEPEAMGEEAEE